MHSYANCDGLSSCTAMTTVRDFHFSLCSGGEGQFTDYWDTAAAKIPAHSGSIESSNSNRSVGSQRIYKNLPTTKQVLTIMV